MTQEHTFQLYDLTVSVEEINGNCTCAMSVGDCFFVNGGKLSLPAGKDFCLYALNSCMPLIPARQRMNHPNDWMESDSLIACPDPNCGLIMRIARTGTRTLNHDDVSGNPLE